MPGPDKPGNRRKALTTGQAAALCAVNTDTVLKWVKKGRLKAARTAGGHYRIDRADLDELLTTKIPRPHVIRANDSPVTVRCWELFARGGQVQAECESCAAYEVRASWCVKVRMDGLEGGQAKRNCHSSCDECLYHQRLRGGAARALIISPDDGTRQRLSGQALEGLELSFAHNGYEASALLTRVRPDFVVVDEVLLWTTEAGLLDYLAGDERMQGIQVGVAVEDPLSGPFAERPHPKADFLVEKPLAAADLLALLRRYAVEVLPESERREYAAAGLGGER